MAEQNRDAIHKVQKYRKLVLVYEALDEEIDQLIMANGGHTEQMSVETMARYRTLAKRRDEVENDMRTLEQELQIDDEDSTIM
jgi:hypothetical protein